MGVRHAREYADILKDLTEAVSGIEGSYSFFDMSKEEWEELAPAERGEIMEALADDVFYGLGQEPFMKVGDGAVAYRPKYHVIEVSLGDKEVRIVRLT
ncbi:hypothetical protein ABEV74_20645 [Paenibacillus cisolokensis]|jgi:hypothetical protein|uniref:hypothetical protein n=1 Tax=Paenibacillus cisolokensis TaxID=1658519 RepID=UPI00071FE288|nr:hypothetical protein [Paenibacillus sp. 32O-W]ALS25693.1 hypothetical protein IJ21_02490 [Paenibacillus sp. 32O-W]